MTTSSCGKSTNCAVTPQASVSELLGNNVKQALGGNHEGNDY